MAENTENNTQPGDGIPSVADDDQKKKNQMFFVGMILLVAAAVAILVMAVQSDTEVLKGDVLEAQVAEEFETADRNLVIPPKKTPRNEARQEPLVLEPKYAPNAKQALLARPTVMLNPQDTETPEEIKARKKQEQYWEKRRRAAPVVFDAMIEQSVASSRGESSSGERHVLDIDAITKSVVDKVGGVSAPSGGTLRGGGRNKDKLEDRLQAAQPVSVTAGYLQDQSYILTEGTMLGCILETAVHSALPGMTRCIVSEDIYSFDGNHKLISKGSQLTGQYEGGIQHGEDRIFVIWTRVLTPEGISVALNSPGTGPLGRAGHGAYVDSHFFERFGASVLLSIIGGLAAGESDNNVRLEIGKSFNQSAEIALKESIKIRPTGHKNQGERIKVFVAKDIDFGPVLRMVSNSQIGG